jgi:hypothetical protein
MPGRVSKMWYENTGKFMPDAFSILADGLRACEKADGASWWEWDKRSAVLFWRWPKDYIETARIDIVPMFDSDPPSNQDKQPPYEEDEVGVKVKAKLEKILGERIYRACGHRIGRSYDVYVSRAEGSRGYPVSVRRNEI